MLEKNFIDFCTRYDVPTKDNVEYNRIYSFDACKVPVKDIFTKYFNNRGGREDSMSKHIKEIRDSIVKMGKMDTIPAITVDINTLQIADGNCRFSAVLDILEAGLLDSLNLRVIFEDIPEDEFDDRVIRLNMGQQSWSLLDFIYNYSRRGYESFTKLIKFCERYDSLHTANGKAINPRYGGAALKLPVSKLKKADLVITDEDIANGNHVVLEANEIRKLFSSDLKANGGGWYEPYLRAWAEFRDCLGEIPFDTYLREVKYTIKNRRRDVCVPYGSNKKQDWNQFFRAVKTYI